MTADPLSARPAALVVSAPASGAGKTTLTLALIRAFRRRGLRVAGAKSGPDFLDPTFLAAAAGRPALNLDAWAMSGPRLRALAAASEPELLLIEGAMGLFDGAADGRGATADVAAALGAPVILTLDVARQGQTAAAVAQGLARFRSDVAVAGVILNRVGSARHEALLRDAFAAGGSPVLGALPRQAALETPSRHLGLAPASERADLEAFLDAAAAEIEERVDLDALAALAGPLPPPVAAAAPLAPLGQRLAIAQDAAFGFLYPHLLADWRAAGAEILPFSPLADEGPDAAADAVFLPGGYPELHAAPLAAAARFKAGLRRAAAAGALIYGECGGYMVLGRGLADAQGRRHAMLDLLPVETSFADPARMLGYRRLSPRAGAPWTTGLTAHEFHYSRATHEEGAPLFDAEDAAGAALAPMGRRVGRVMGSYAHVIDAGEAASR